MIWQRSVVAKEKVRTIEVNDYGSSAGLAGFLSSSGSGFVVAHVGFRCLTLIS